MPAPVAGIHVFLLRCNRKTWMAGTYARRRASRFSPAMTIGAAHELVNVYLSPSSEPRLSCSRPVQ
jgi:hypothetical protein